MQLKHLIEEITRRFSLLKKKIPEYLTGILIKKYAVRCGSEISFYFEISNGIRKGVVFSPILYNLYTDSLSRNYSVLVSVVTLPENASTI